MPGMTNCQNGNGGRELNGQPTHAIIQKPYRALQSFVPCSLQSHSSCIGISKQCIKSIIPDSEVHGANIGTTWVLLAPDGPLVGPMNLAIRDVRVGATQKNTGI